MPRVVIGRRVARRTFLRGAGAALALPFLDAMVPAFAREASGPRRMLFVFVPNGKAMAHWTPATVGADFALPSILEPLAELRGEFSVLTGLTLDGGRAHGDGPGDHARSVSSFLTAAHPVKTAGANIGVGVSVDQVAARKLGRKTRFASLELGCERGRSGGSCDSGYSCAYSNNVSWRNASTPNAKEVDPRQVFERLFGGGDAVTPEVRAERVRRRKSVLDAVLDDVRRLRGDLGPTDRRKLDEYVEGVREIEVRIERAESESVDAGMERPHGVPARYAEHIHLMQDLIVAAFRADLTRVVTFMLANGGSNRSYGDIGVSGGHHHLSHHGGDPAKLESIRKINRFHVTQLARLLAELRRAPDGDGSLLDNSMLVYGSGLGDGNRHNHEDLPVLLAGRGGGTLNPGRHVRHPRETPMANLYLALLDRMNVREASFADSTGRLQEI